MAEVEENRKIRPLWFYVAGSGTHRQSAGSDLMKIPTFAATIERAAAVLRPLDVDLVWILTEAPVATIRDVINSMVSITATQIALIDVLREIGLHPDGIFAVSLGELGAAYADETLTVEQTMLIAYWRARCVLEANVPVGPKAILFMTKDEFDKRSRPPDVEILSYFIYYVIVAGPHSSIQKFVDDLASEGIVSKIAGVNMLQYHTSHVEAAIPAFRDHLTSIIRYPKPHSSKWISTSVPLDKWDNEAKLIGVEFFTNNLRSPVDKISAYHKMPKNAVLVEISANPKMLSLMANLPETITPVEILHKDAPDSRVCLLDSIGKIYKETGRQLPSGKTWEMIRSNFTDSNDEH